MNWFKEIAAMCCPFLVELRNREGKNLWFFRAKDHAETLLLTMQSSQLTLFKSFWHL